MASTGFGFRCRRNRRAADSRWATIPTIIMTLGSYTPKGWSRHALRHPGSTEERDRGLSCTGHFLHCRHCVESPQRWQQREQRPHRRHLLHRLQRVASGLCKWHWDTFIPIFIEGAMKARSVVIPMLPSFPVPALRRMKTWLSWLKISANAGFDGWRYDHTKGYHPWVVNDMNAATGPAFPVGEYWDANTTLLDTWVNTANRTAFDFAAYYTLQEHLQQHRWRWQPGGRAGCRPNVTPPKIPGRRSRSLPNHDTDEISRATK